MNNNYTSDELTLHELAATKS